MKYYLGVDIGGTHIRMVLLKGLRPQKPLFLKMRSWNSPAKLEQALSGHIGEFLGNAEGYLAGVGVSVAGIVDEKRGVLIRVQNIPALNGWKVKNFFSYLKAPVRVANDAHCFLNGEMKWGVGQRKKHLVGVAIGTGIGGAIVIDKKFYCGANGSAGEVGFIIMREKPPKFFEDLGALTAYRRWGDRSSVIGLGVASIINMLDPEMVILGGVALMSKDFHMDVVRRIVRAHLINPMAQKTPIVKGKLGESAQAIGAALLFRDAD